MSTNKEGTQVEVTKDKRIEEMKRRLEPILDRHFPKNLCQERGAALMMFTEIILQEHQYAQQQVQEAVIKARREAQQEERQYILNTIELYSQKPSKGLDWLKWFMTRKVGDNGSTTLTQTQDGEEKG